MKSSLIPSTLIGASHLGRYVLRPDGPDGVSFTLSMYDTSIPSGDGGTWIGYRLYQRTPGGDRKGTVLFENRLLPPSPTKDPADLAKLILDTLAAGPGDLDPDPTVGYTPEQLEFASRWGVKVRKAAQAKFGWSDDQLTKLRADLDIVWNRRDDAKAHARHQLKSGVIGVSARTKREAVAEFRAAVRNHVSMVPDFRVGQNTKQLYCLYPHGAEMVIQCLRPQFPESPLGDAMRFRAADLEDAKRTFYVITRGLEAPPETSTRYVPVVPEQKVSPIQPANGGSTEMFDSPIPKSRKSGPRGLPSGLIPSPQEGR